MKPTELKMTEVRDKVRERYSEVAGSAGSPGTAGCGSASSSCCGTPSAGDIDHVLGYSADQVNAVPEGCNLGLGCGNPLAIASLRPGQTVLDLGAGAGFDAFLAARAVGPGGFVIGIDMTPAMITKARTNKAKGEFTNVEFRLGEIESLPVADASVDVIISNCVINLSPDKPRVFREAFRVLKPGGRLAIADVVALRPIPDALRSEWELYTGCVAGAALAAELAGHLQDAGFADIRIEPRAESARIVSEWFPGRGVEEYVASATIEATRPER